VTFVNTLVTVSPRVPEHDAKKAAGRRLKAALDGYFPRARGGLRGLAEEASIGPETLYRWFRGDSEPDLGTLARVAVACGVSRTVLVAAMDGEEVPFDQPPAWASELMAEVRMLRDESLAVAAARAVDVAVESLGLQPRAEPARGTADQRPGPAPRRTRRVRSSG